MYGYVYLTTNVINNKKYIGQHKAKTFDEHYKGSGKTIAKAFKKYGFENFKCEVIEWCETKEILSEREQYWISYYNAVLDENFYNIDSGRGNSHEYVCEESTRKKLSENQQGRKVMNNGIENKYLKPEEFEQYLASGWVFGQKPKDRTSRVNKFKETHKNKDNFEWRNNIRKSITGRKWVNNGIEEKQIKIEEFDSYIQNGWIPKRLFAKGKK